MERARRDAANPLRMIIEASQAKARAKTPEPATAPPASTAVAPARTAERKPTARAEGAADVATSKPAAPPAAGGITERVQALPQLSQAAPPAAAPAAAAPSDAAGQVPAAAAATDPTARRSSPPPDGAAAASSTSPGTTAAAGPATDQSLASAAPRVPAPPAVAAPASARVAETPLKLTHYIEPELPQRLRSRLKPNTEVTVVFKVNVDGSVSDLDIRATGNRSLDPIVLDAVRQWRYDPVPEARIHAVQLVFNLDN